MHARPFRSVANSSDLEQYLRSSLGDRRAVEAIGRVQVGEIARLAEPFDAKRRDPLPEDSAQPR